jgi:hypothetical protein
VYPCRSRIFSLTLTGKGKEREDASHARRRDTSWTTIQIWPNPQRGGAKARCLQVSKLGMTPQAKMNLQGHTTTNLHLHGHHTNALWQEVKQVSHPLVMIVMMNVMIRENPLVMMHDDKFFEDVCTKQKAQLKTLKNKLISSQNDYKCLLEKFKIFANLNCELTTKIEQLESNAPSSTTDDSLIKKDEKLKAELASSHEAIENLLEKIEIISIHNNELTAKLENIGSTLGASLIEISEIIKKDVSTSCFDLIDDSNPCNQVLVKNVVIETCSYGIAMDNEQLKQEVARLGKALYDKKGKAKQIQPQ